MSVITYSNAYYDSNNQRHILTTGSSNNGSMTINTQVPDAFVFNSKMYAFSNPYIQTSFGDVSNRYTTLITGSNIGILYNSSNISQSNYTFPTGSSNEVSIKYSLSNLSVHINRTQVLSATHSNCKFEDNTYFQISASNRAINASNSAYIQYPIVQPVIAVSPPTEFHGSVKVNGSLINSNLTIISNQANFSSNVSTFSSNALSNYFLNTTGTTLSNYAYSNLNNRVTTANDTANWASNNIPSIDFSSNSSVWSSNTASYSSNALLKKTGDTMTGALTVLSSSTLCNTLVRPQSRLWFYSIGDCNHSMYQNNLNQDAEGVFNGVKWNTNNGLWVRTGVAQGAVPLTCLYATSNRLAIGKNNPTQALDVSGNIVTTGSVGVGITPLTGLHLNTDFHIGCNNGAWNTTAGRGLYMRYSTNGGQDATYIQSVNRAVGTLHNIAIEGSNIAIGNTNALSSPALYCRFDKNVGIGTNAPAEKLDVIGNIKASGTVVGTNITTLSNIVYWTSNNALYPIQPLNYYGIGTSNPQDKLHINNGGLYLSQSTQFGYTQINIDNQYAGQIGNIIAGNDCNLTISSYNSNATVKRPINLDGSIVGIGVNNPTSVQGSILNLRTSNSLANVLHIENTGDGRAGLTMSIPSTTWFMNVPSYGNLTTYGGTGNIDYIVKKLTVASEYTFSNLFTVGTYSNSLFEFGYAAAKNTFYVGTPSYPIPIHEACFEACINSNVQRGMVISRENSPSSVDKVVEILNFAVTPNSYNSVGSCINVNKVTTTGRSISVGGTVNTGGADVAEYFQKKDNTFTIPKGAVCGIDENGKLTNKFSESITFVIKTTEPALVMADNWFKKEKPTDSNLISQWEAELEEKRQLQDRIGICGRVPVNYTGDYDVGDYVVPIKSGENDITVKVEKEQTISFKDYKSAVGRIVERLPDGRPFVLVKPV